MYQSSDSCKMVEFSMTWWDCPPLLLSWMFPNFSDWCFRYWKNDLKCVQCPVTEFHSTVGAQYWVTLPSLLSSLASPSSSECHSMLWSVVVSKDCSRWWSAPDDNIWVNIPIKTFAGHHHSDLSNILLYRHL